MRKYNVALLALILLIPKGSFAESTPTRAFQIGTEVYEYKYREPDLGVKITGVFVGIGGSYSKHMDPFMLRLEGRGAYGPTDYSSNSGSSNNINDYVFESRILWGYDFFVEGLQVDTVYTGFGYRFLRDAGGGTFTTLGNWGYDRESNYYYLPLGLEGEVVLEEGRWVLSTNVEYDVLLKGVQKTYLSTGPVPGYNDISDNQNKGYGVRGSIKFRKLNERWDFQIEPFVRYWNIHNSEIDNETFNGTVIDQGLEPTNETLEYGVNLSLFF